MQTGNLHCQSLPQTAVDKYDRQIDRAAHKQQRSQRGDKAGGLSARRFGRTDMPSRSRYGGKHGVVFFVSLTSSVRDADIGTATQENDGKRMVKL